MANRAAFFSPGAQDRIALLKRLNQKRELELRKLSGLPTLKSESEIKTREVDIDGAEAATVNRSKSQDGTTSSPSVRGRRHMLKVRNPPGGKSWVQDVVELRDEYVKNGGKDQLILDQFAQLQMDAQKGEREEAQHRGEIEEEGSSVKKYFGKLPSIQSSSSTKGDSDKASLQALEDDIRAMAVKRKMKALGLQQDKKEEVATLAEVAKIIQHNNQLLPAEGPSNNESTSHHPAHTQSNHPAPRRKYLDLKSSEPFSVSQGFVICWDFLSGLVDVEGTLHINFCLLEAAEPRQDVTALQPLKISPHNETLPLVFASNFENIKPILSYRIIVELRIDDASSGHKSKSLGWSSFDLFDPRMVLDSGYWKQPIFEPPVDFSQSTKALFERGKQVKGLYLLLRIANTSVAPQVASDPMTMDDLSAYILRPQSEMIKTPRSPISIQAPPTAPNKQPIIQAQNENTDGLLNLKNNLASQSPETVSASVKPDTTDEHIPSTEFSFGILLEKIEGLIDLYPKVRIRIDDEERVPQTQKDKRIIESTAAEPGVEDRTHGWADKPFNHVFDHVAAIPERQLVLEITNKFSPESAEEVICWTSLDLFIMNYGNAVLNTGSFRLHLYLPATGDKSTGPKPISKTAALSFIIYDPNNGTPVLKPFKAQLVSPAIPFNAWINCTKVKDSIPPFEEGKGFELYIDGARYLPSNVGISRVSAKIIDSTHRPLLAEGGIETTIDFDSVAHSPTYGHYQRFILGRTNPTSMLYFKIYAIENIYGKPVVVGHAAINLFNVTSKVAKSEFYLHEGAFQLPILTGLPDRNQSFSMPALEGKRRVPCASLLIRIVEYDPDAGLKGSESSDNYSSMSSSSSSSYSSASDEDVALGKYFPPPRYLDAVYNSQLCYPLSYEERIFAAVVNESSTQTIRDYIKNMLDNEPGLFRLHNASDASLKFYILKQLLPVPLKKEYPLLDYSYVCRYQAKYGFSISVDGAQNLTHAGFTESLLVLCPPSTLYHRHSAAYSTPPDSIKHVNKIDYDKPIKSPKWDDGFHWYQGVPLTLKDARYINVIVDIRTLIRKGKKWVMEKQGWTALQIFNDEGYVQMGAFQWPLFEGEPTKDLLHGLTCQPADQVLAAALENGEIVLCAKYSSVFVRVADARRTEEFDGDRGGYIIKVQDWVKDNFLKEVKSPKVVSLVPEGRMFDEFNAELIKTFAEELNSRP